MRDPDWGVYRRPQTVCLGGMLEEGEIDLDACAPLQREPGNETWQQLYMDDRQKGQRLRQPFVTLG